MDADMTFLDGKMLMAMPGMGDPRFEHALIYVCAHSSDGAMGLMINKPAPELGFADLLKQLGISVAETHETPAIFFGGPVEYGRGFVLHTGEYSSSKSTLRVDDRFAMTATVDILRDIAEGNGPREALLTLGYSGWGPGQLERELQAHGWLTCDADEALIFEIAPEARWETAMDRLGIDHRLLSSDGGRA